MANPPGVNVTVNTPSSSPKTNAATGTWFVTGLTAGGPTGVAVPVNSIQDYTTYFGTYQNNAVAARTTGFTTLYDALDIYFREGGIRAYVARAVHAGGGVAATLTLGTNFVTLTASGPGTWANSASTSPQGLIVTVATGTAGGITLSVYNNGIQVGNTSPLLFANTDVQNWVNSLAVPGVLFNVTLNSGTPSLPAAGSYYFTGGTDVSLSSGIVDSDYQTAAGFFPLALGPGQISVPGVTTQATAVNLIQIAQNSNRVALLDAVDGAGVDNAAALITTATAIQTSCITGGIDPSYGAQFGPWIKSPGISTTQPNTIAPVFQRVIPPTAYVAANIAFVDNADDANVPAAGVVNGSCAYANDVSTTYAASERVSLNAAGVNLMRNINGQVSVYGFRSLAADSNWTAFNNVRFRMQIANDFDVLSEPFVFQEIDGKGQVFARLAGVLAGQCQNYWLRNSLYGVNASDAYTVNTGPQVNTPATIAAGQINAQVNVRMAPQAEQVSVTITKYLVSNTLPSY